MERLEILRSIIAIFRDILLIIAFIAIIVLGFTITNFVNSIDTSKLSCEGLVKSIISGDFDIFGESRAIEKYQPTEKMLDLMKEIEKAALSGDKDTAISKLDELKDLANSAGMTEAVKKIDELKAAIKEENYVKALSTASTLKKMFGQ